MANLKEQFIEQGATIRYRCWAPEGGHVIAQFDRHAEVWLFRHDSESEFHREPMSLYKARSIFPTDAELVEA